MKTVFLNSTSLGKLAAHIADELEMTALSVTLKDQDRDEDDGQLLEASIVVALAPRPHPAETTAPATAGRLHLPRPGIYARAVSRRHSL